jgi:hypothetical protein
MKDVMYVGNADKISTSGTEKENKTQHPRTHHGQQLRDNLRTCWRKVIIRQV